MEIIKNAVLIVLFIGVAAVFVTNLVHSKSPNPEVRKGKFIEALIDGIGLTAIIAYGLEKVFPFWK